MLSSIKRNNLSAMEEEDADRYLPHDDGAEMLPFNGRLTGLLGLDARGHIENILRNALLYPVRELTANQGKKVRGALVQLGYRLLDPEGSSSVAAADRIKMGSEVLELIHAGSLIVDDIEDGSPVRRGRPALHVQYGIPLALNVGNWLYFWPFQLVAGLALSREKTLAAYEAYQRTLLRAHFGQALDLGTRVDTLEQDRVAEVCFAMLKLKTGALTGFAMVLGGLIAGADEPTSAVLDDFGRDLGVALQMFDDIGNVTGAREPAKRYEDFMLRRPSFAWAWAADNCSPRSYAEFVSAVAKLPDANDLGLWLDRHDLIAGAKARAVCHMEKAFANLKCQLDARRISWSATAYDELRAMGENISVAYG